MTKNDKESKEDPKRAVPNTALLLRMLLRKKNRKKQESTSSELHSRSQMPDSSIRTVSLHSLQPISRNRSSSFLSDTASLAVGCDRGGSMMAVAEETPRHSVETVQPKPSINKRDLKKIEKAKKNEKEKLKIMEENYDPDVESTKFEVVKGGVRPAHTKLRKRNIMMDGKAKFKVDTELEMLRERCKKQEDEIRELKLEVLQLKELNEKLSSGAKPCTSTTDSGESLQMSPTERMTEPFVPGGNTLSTTTTVTSTNVKQQQSSKPVQNASSAKDNGKKKPKDDDSVCLMSPMYL